MADTSAMRVVIIDDNPGDVMLLQVTLEDAGYTQIHSCSTAADFMSHVASVTAEDERIDVDLVFLDVRLPDTDGFAFCQLEVPLIV